MIKQKYRIARLIRHKPRLFFKAGTTAIAIIVLAMGFVLPRVEANSVSQQIAQLERENAANYDMVASLREQATSYEDAINQLQAAINALQIQIDANTAEQNRLQAEIVQAEEDLAKQRQVLGANIKAMYLEGQVTTLEMLASSKDLSEFIDKQQYRTAVQEKIKTTLDKITALKFQLKSQKEQVESLLNQQQIQRANMAASQQEQQALLSYNKSQQDEYNQKTRDNQKKIDALIAAQRRANFSPDGGYYFLRFPGQVRQFNPNDYPYKNAGFGMSPYGCADNDGPDVWGYCTRQCVSYTAWAVEASGRTAPRGYGNAKDWVSAAYAIGIPVYRTPQPGDVAISTSGFWGHAMYVESVSGNTFTTTEYNTYLNGQLSYQTRSF